MKNKPLYSKLFFAFVILFFSIFTQAQLKKGDLVDGISAVIGGEIVLQSEIEEQENYAKQQGAQVGSKCELLERTISNKLLYHYAKQDTLIQNRTKDIQAGSDQKYKQFLSGFASEKEMLLAYKFRTAYEMKTAIQKMELEQYYTQAKFQLITSGIDVTPNEVQDFYKIHQLEFPEIKEEIVLSKIVKNPKLNEAHKQEIIAKLKKIRQDILNGESFESQARIFSEDTGSANNGGLYTNINRGQMVKAFEATALNLLEGDISEPVESEFGYHIIKLEKKSGKLYDARHILLLATPNKEEIAQTKKELDSIRTLILEKKLSFKEAAFKFSEDKSSKFNAGVISNKNTGSDKLERLNLPSTTAYQIAGMNKGDISEAFEDKEEKDKVVVEILMLNDTIAAHMINMQTDYERIKKFALQEKQNQKIESWIKDKLPDTFMKINDRFKNCDLTSKYRK